MRDFTRLDSFYDELKRIHKTFFPSWRLGQLCWNLVYWLNNGQNIDPYYLSENNMLKYINRFVQEYSNLSEEGSGHT